ncbi:MAG TPA: sensor histidine kinase [Lutibacter sp.]|nr:sensor histidine kinase [Lutibacter sp.]
MKNPTPKQIIVITSAILSVGMLLSLILLKITGQLTTDYIWLFVLAILLFVFSYLIFSYFIEKYIYRKIKLIYKYINELKQTDSIKPLRLQNDVVKNVELEVSKWAMSKRKEIKQLKETEKLRREFLGNVSHELKTPIFSIQGYIESLIDGGRKDKEITKKFLNKALENTNRLSLIVDDLEMISRSESGKLELVPEHFSINKLLQEVMDSMEMKATDCSVFLSFKEENPTDFVVYADRDRIAQVLINLFSNSIKYNNKYGKTLVACYDMEENVLIELSDKGIGIEEKHIPRLFERFYRVDKTRSRNKGGTGLGLAIVKHIIEAHHQTINVRSKIGVGSTFGFTLKKSNISI